MCLLVHYPAARCVCVETLSEYETTTKTNKHHPYAISDDTGIHTVYYTLCSVWFRSLVC